MRFELKGQGTFAVEFNYSEGDHGRRRTYVDVLQVIDGVKKESWPSLYSAYAECSKQDRFTRVEGREKALAKLYSKVPASIQNGVKRAYFARRKANGVVQVPVRD